MKTTDPQNIEQLYLGNNSKQLINTSFYNVRSILFFIVFSMVLFSQNDAFAQLKRLSVDVPVKPKVIITDSIQSFTLLNRSLTPEYSRNIPDSLQVNFYRKNFNAELIILDSLVADTTLRALGELLYESLRYDVVIPQDRNIMRTLPYNQTNKPLDWDYVKNICGKYNTDALIVMENMAIRTKTTYNRQDEYTYDIYDRYQQTHRASIKDSYRTQWRIYYPKNQIILADVTHLDTLYWNSYELDVYDAFSSIPTIHEAAIRTGIQSAMRFSDLIAPQWETTRRYYYALKNADIDASETYALANDWENALTNWLRFVDKGSRSNRSKIMLNIALSYEMLGNVPEAILWIQKSITTDYREITNSYYKTLLKKVEKSNKK